ncbi:hypothetical protein GTP46_27695 [Duganella sp. FT135W]|uniref:Uncharacterized protein n=1 Tax=Duganella flavida TaxID=2692175 RepID=A0A6L8KGC9_9BURK|nr:hypothetical protein [Duganella flavida]MYM26416.1 hypothetical protein [Duganella flavida]
MHSIGKPTSRLSRRIQNNYNKGELTTMHRHLSGTRLIIQGPASNQDYTSPVTQEVEAQKGQVLQIFTNACGEEVVVAHFPTDDQETLFRLSLAKEYRYQPAQP